MARTESPEKDGSGKFLSGVKVYPFSPSIEFSKRRVGIWTKRLAELGGEAVQDPGRQDVTVVLVGELPVPRGCRPPSGAAPLVSVHWLEQCLQQRRRLPTADFPVKLRHSEPVKRKAPEPPSPAGPLRRYAKWLGFWRPEFDAITHAVELVLQAKFCAAGGRNERIVAQLRQLHKFECAVAPEVGSEEDGAIVVSHHALQYARAAAVVRAAAFQISADADPAELAASLPFVGGATARVLQSLAATGTCEQLDAFREGKAVRNSKGEERPDTAGGNVRRLFVKLPGCGVRTAERWFKAGLRSFEDVEAALAGQLSRVSVTATKAQRFSLERRADLLEQCPAADIAEMRACLLRTLRQLTGAEWELWLVGGARRSVASHDADFVVSHASVETEGVLARLVAALQREGRLIPKEQGMCLTQTGRMAGHLQKLRDGPADSSAHNLESDRYDRLVGLYVTEAGKVRRMDVILPPWEEVPFCLISWTGDKQYNRFLRLFAAQKGMSLNAHRLMRQQAGEWRVVPDELPPLDSAGREFWPPGWDSERRVASERDVFELLQLPYREPWERNCQ